MTELDKVQKLIQESQVFERTGDVSAALQRALQAVETARSLDHSPAYAEALVCLAKIRFRLGKYQVAEALCQEARHLADPGTVVVVDSWQVSANCAAEMDSLAEAENCYLRAADLARETGYRRGHIAALHGIAAGVYLPRGQFALALAVETEVRQLIQQEGYREDLIYPLITTSITCQSTGQQEQVSDLLNELADLATPGSLAEGYLYCLQGNHTLEQGTWEEARALYLRARSTAEACGEPWLNINVRLGMSRYHRLKDEGAIARQWAEDACRYAASLSCRYELGRALIERGQANWLCGQLQAAQDDFQAAIAILKKLEAAYDLARGQLLLAVLLNAQKHADALAAWRTAAGAIFACGYGFLLQQERRQAFPLVAEHLNHPDREIAALSAQLLSLLEKTPAPPLHISVLGDFTIVQEHHTVSPALLKQRQAGELFRLLLISPGRRLSREQVIEALWPEKSASTATNFFHQATSALRHALEPDLPDKFPSRYLVVEEGQVTLCLPPRSLVDYEQFEKHLSKDEWQQAVSLWQGEPFKLDRYKDWATWKREQLTHGYLRALLKLAESYQATGSAELAQETCQKILQTDPWQEKAVWIAMQTCLQQGDRSQALRIYLSLERRLREELGISPVPELRELYQSLVRSK